MARNERLIWGFVLGFALAFCAEFVVGLGAAYAGDPNNFNRSQGQAFADCSAEAASIVYSPSSGITIKCDLQPVGQIGPPGSCNFGGGPVSFDRRNGSYRPHATGPGGFDNPSAGHPFDWCEVGQCPVGQKMYGGRKGWRQVGAGMVVPVSDDLGCCVTWMNDYDEDGTGSWSYNNVNMEYGYYQTNGQRCSGPLNPPEDKIQKRGDSICDHGAPSCFDPHKNKFCGTTEYGEQVCEPAPKPGKPGGCGSGATGTVCVGTDPEPPPKPGDPPIPKDKPPDRTDHGSITDKNNVTNNYTQNTYSGTSSGGGSGSGDSGGDSGGSGGGDSGGKEGGSPGGTGSNTAGHGNSGDKGTDDKGQCPDGKVPTASGCSGTYRDAGCDTPPACFGDAVLCGIAANTHKSACNPASGSSTGAKYDLPDGIPGDGGRSEDGDPAGAIEDREIGSGGFDAAGLGFSRSCPAPPTFNFRGKTFTIDTGPVCDWASMFGWFVLLFGYLAAMRIVATGRA